MPKAVFYGELCQGKRDCWTPHKRFKDQLKHQLPRIGIDHKEWEQLAEDRLAGVQPSNPQQTTVKSKEKQLAEDTLAGGQPSNPQQTTVRSGEKLQLKKSLSNLKDSSSQPETNLNFICSNCSRASKSKIGLHSHREHVAGIQPLPCDPRKQQKKNHYKFFRTGHSGECPCGEEQMTTARFLQNYSTLAAVKCTRCCWPIICAGEEPLRLV